MRLGPMLLAWIALACACGGRTAKGTIAPHAEPVQAGALLTGLTLWEQVDGEPTLRLSARVARIELSPRAIDLEGLEAKLHSAPSGLERVSITAPRGRLPARSDTLELEGGVRATDLHGRVLESRAARYQSRTRTLELPAPTRVRGPRGVLQAGQARANLADESIVLEGGVEAEVTP